MSGTPPAPGYTRSRVIPSAAYIQLSPFEKVALRERYDSDVAEDSFWQDDHARGAYFKVAGLGRSVMPELDVAANYVSRDVTFPQGLTSDVQKALWTAQVLAFWLTDGVAYKQYRGMEGLVSANGHDPSNPSAVLDPNGYAKADLRTLLNPKDHAGDRDFVKGPDSIFGPELESVVVEYAGTGKLFGKPVPAVSKPVMDKLLTQVSTPKISQALARAKSGSPPQPSAGTALTPCSALTSAARAARKDCGSGADRAAAEASQHRRVAESSLNSRAPAETDSDNTLLYVGAAGLALAIGAAALLIRRSART